MRLGLALLSILPLLAGGCVTKAIDRFAEPGPSAAARKLPDPIPVGDDVADEMDRVCPILAAGSSPCPALEGLLDRVFRHNDELKALAAAE